MSLNQPPFGPKYDKPGSAGGDAAGSNRRSERKVRKDWPSTVFQKLGRGFHWLSLTKAPESHVLIRERDSQFPWKLYVGIPQQVDPETEYEWAPTAAANMAAVPAVGGEAGAGTTTRNFVDCEIIAGPVPYNYGRVVGSVTIAGTDTRVLTGIRTESCKAIALIIENNSAGGFTFSWSFGVDGDMVNDSAVSAPITKIIAGGGVAIWSVGAWVPLGAEDQRVLPDFWNLDISAQPYNATVTWRAER